MPSLFAGCPNSPNSRGTRAKIAPPLCTHCSNYVSTLLLYPHAAWIQARAERTSSFGMHRRDLLTSRSDLHLFSRAIDVAASGAAAKNRSDEDPIFRDRSTAYVYFFDAPRDVSRENKRVLSSNRELLLAFYSSSIIRQVEPMPDISLKLARTTICSRVKFSL